MPEHSVRLMANDLLVGEIFFDQSPKEFELLETVSGVNVRIPASIVLRWKGEPEPCPFVTNLHVKLDIETTGGKKIEVTRIQDLKSYFGTRSATDHPEQTELYWRDVERLLAFIVSKVGDQSPRFTFRVDCDLYLIVKAVAANPPDGVWMNNPSYAVMSFPRRIHESIEFSYPLECWRKLISSAL